MKCDDIKLLMMDFLYEEISGENMVLLKKHLGSCVSCREEFESLKETSGILQQLEEVDPKLNFVFVQEQKQIWSAIKESFTFSPKKIFYGFALGFASVVLLFSLVNMEISIKDGDFSLKMGLFKQESRHSSELSPAQKSFVAQLQRQNVQLIKQLIEQSEQRQRQELAATLANFSQEYDLQRTTDLQMMGAGLDEIEKTLYMRLERRTNDQINNLIRYINQNQGGQRK